MNLSSEVVQLTRQAWSTVTGDELAPIDGGRPFREGDIWSTIVIQGEMECGVMLCCSEDLARHLTGQMLGMSPEEITPEDTFDAIGEMVNIVGGNLKEVVPGATKLSLPCVSKGNGIFERPIAHASSSCQVFKVNDELLEVIVVYQPALVGASVNGSAK